MKKFMYELWDEGYCLTFIPKKERKKQLYSKKSKKIRKLMKGSTPKKIWSCKSKSWIRAQKKYNDFMNNECWKIYKKKRGEQDGVC